jgi:cytochrome c-type biogenesis protein CcsB
MTSSQLFNLTTIAYFAAMILFLAYLVIRSPKVGLIATLIAWAGFAANSGAILTRWMEARALGFDQAPLSNLYESIVFFAWSILLFYLLIDLRYRQRSLGAFVLPFAFFGMVWAQFGLNDAIEPLVPALQSNWLTYHVITCFLGYAGFAVACGASIMYLLVAGKNGEKPKGILALFPDSRILDDINYKAIMIGFPLLTLGIVTGAAWANYAWGTYWSWDPKETWSLIVWFIYAAFLHARFTRGWVGRRAAYLSIAGFAATIFCYLGVNLVLSGLHSYGG